MMQMILFGVIVLVLGVIPIVLFYRAEIKWRDQRIDVLMMGAGNKDIYIDELQQRCQRLLQQTQNRSPFSEYQVEQDESVSQYRVYLN